MLDWSTEAGPVTTWPSAAILSPSRTRITSPLESSLAGVSRYPASVLSRATSGVSSSRPATASPDTCSARSLSILPKFIMNAITAAAVTSSPGIAAMMAMLTSSSTFDRPPASPRAAPMKIGAPPASARASATAHIHRFSPAARLAGHMARMPSPVHGRENVARRRERT